MSRRIRIYTVCHSVLDFRLKPLCASKLEDGRVHFRNSGLKGLIHWTRKIDVIDIGVSNDVISRVKLNKDAACTVVYTLHIVDKTFVY